MRFLPLLCLSLLLPALAGARAPAAPPSPDDREGAAGEARAPARGGRAAAWARQVAPFMGGDTVLVARIDLPRVNLGAAENWVNAAMLMAEAQAGGEAGAAKGEADAARREEAENDLARTMATAGQWLAAMRDAGAEGVYVVVGMSGTTPTPALVVPMKDKRGADAVRKLLAPGGAGDADEEGRPARQTTAVMRGAVVLGQRSTLRAMKESEGADPAAVEAGLRAAGEDTTAQALFMPSLQMKLMASLGAAALGKEAGADLTAVPAAIKWVSLGVGAPPEASARLVIQTPGDESAGKLAATLNGLLARAAEGEEVRREVPRAGELAKMLAPKVEGDRVVLNLTDDDLKTFTSLLFRAKPEGRDRREARERDSDESDERDDIRKPSDRTPEPAPGSI